MRKKIIAGNWKMHLGPKEAEAFAKSLTKSLQPSATKSWVVFPPSVSLGAVKIACQESFILWGAQNCHWESKGAFTGEISPGMLKELGCHMALVGHSERRQYFAETNLTCAKKIQALIQLGITPMYCVGETLQERESGKTQEVLSRQLEEGLSLWDRQSPLVIAYEPVWAIGTGKTATPEQAEKAHAFIRSEVSRLSSANVAGSLPILYGGSVKPENSRELGLLPNIDGFLVGGASMDVKSFAQIGDLPL